MTKRKAPIGKIVISLLAIAAVAAMVFYTFQEGEQLVTTASVQQGPLEASFTAEGKTRLKQRYHIAAPVSGTLRRITLQPGDAVQAGDVLAEIEPASASLLDARSRQQAQGEVRAAQAALAAARQRTQAAKVSEQLARTQLARLQPLQAAGAASREQYDQAHTQAQTARAQLAAAQAEENTAQERVRIAQAQLLEAQDSSSGNANTTGSNAKNKAPRALAITAPASGQILRRLRESAAPVAAGEQLLEIGDSADLEIEVEVLSADAVRLRPGVAARILRWGGEHTLHAKVRRIEPGGFTKVSALGVEEQRTRVILDFDSPHEQWAALGDAYRVDVEFITDQASDALQVPSSALFRTSGAQPTAIATAPNANSNGSGNNNTGNGSANANAEGWAVYRVRSEGPGKPRAERTPVQLGLRSATHAQITQGLQAGDRVILQPDDQIRDGSRLRITGGN